ncbi:GNAT family N-acetyltransferase [uncultured Maribacter sp.]|uniref:GNAT family N-acetyltransferase n=1 Tax=uncultured Maribacter sp. TaxID=431308 RepID=UPI00260BC3C8|nr:GNAT family N-acetyltransferase [uncultured Maribacter sp.]
MQKEENKLDNVVLHSLLETHKKYAIEYEGITFYNPTYCPFGGFTSTEKNHIGIDQYATLSDDFFIVGQKPKLGNKVYIEKELVCNQMVLSKPIELESNAEITPIKTSTQKEEVFHLVNMVQPGYFRKKTSDLGTYFGIYINGYLISVCGERMQMNKYTEISAVVTHPKHSRKGYAKQLIKHTSDHILSKNKIPFLHVAETNSLALKLYEKLGFKTRRKISFWNIKSNQI